MKFNTDFSRDRAQSKTKKLDKIVGILNSKFIIHKYKGFNKKKIGYIPIKLDEVQTLDNFDNVTSDEIAELNNNNEQAYFDRLYKQSKLLKQQQEKENSVQRYVEVVEDIGIKRFIYIFLLLITIAFSYRTLKNSSLAEDWNFDPKNLILFKTEEQTIFNENNIEIGMNVTPTFKNNVINLNLISEEVDNISFTCEIIDNETGLNLYKSDELIKSGTSITNIEIKEEEVPEELREIYFSSNENNIYRSATVRCETYKGLDEYLGDIEQQIQIKIKKGHEIIS